MSEYQFYEFKSIDKPLSEKDKAEIGSWSSRTSPSNTGATFTYHYSDFRKDEIKVVEKYFDAMFYISNWGTTRLIFKLPNALIDLRYLRQFRINDVVRLIEKPDFTLLDINVSDEEGGGMWTDGEGYLSSLIPLRSDILSGDYRSLYLIWLNECTNDVLYDCGDVDPGTKEPKVPNNLNSLSGALLDFVELFEIGKDLIDVAAEKSRVGVSESIENYSQYITQLPNDEKDELLLRLLKKEPLLDVKLEKRLKDFVSEGGESNSVERRTVGEIAKSIKERKEKREVLKNKKRKEVRLARLRKIEQNEINIWPNVMSLINEKRTKSYEEAIKLLQDLKELSIHKKQFDDFCKKIITIKQKYSRLSALQRGIDYGKLTKNF
jgi:hypothetical protein